MRLLKCGLAPLLALSLLAGCDRDADAPPVPAAGDQAPALPPITVDEMARIGRAFPALATQVALDAKGFSPGVIDGKGGQSFEKAVAALEAAADLPADGQIDERSRSLLDGALLARPVMRIRLPEAMARRSWLKLPAKPEDQARLSELGYATPWEYLAERYHTTPELLVALNAPEADPASAPTAAAAAASPPLAAGDTLLVPAVAPDLPVMATPAPSGDERDARWAATLTDLGVAAQQPSVARIEVTKSDGVLRAFDAEDRLVMMASATMGSTQDPLPIGDWTVKGNAFNPPFTWNPELFWDVSDDREKLHLPPGPNSPVGVVWIDLSKDHYGIHGTPEPQTIGRAESHGCVRLTNWDAARLAQMVKPGVEVHFRP